MFGTRRLIMVPKKGYGEEEEKKKAKKKRREMVGTFLMANHVVARYYILQFKSNYHTKNPVAGSSV